MNCIRCKSPLPEGACYCPACGKKQTPEKRKALKRANGMGTVYMLQGRRKRPWVAAKNRVVIGYYERKKDALEALERTTGQSITERYNMTFSDVYKEWKQEHFPTLTDSGRYSYSHAYEIFSPLHNRRWRELRTLDFQKALEPYMRQKHSTVSKYKQLITQMSEWAIREEICTTNFAKFVRLPENIKKEKEIFTDAEISKLEADNSETAKIILMLIYTGMRIGELFSLPLSDYHKGYVIGGEKTEAGRNRIIPIRPEGRKYFEYFASQATGELLLSGYVGDKISSNFRKRCYYPLLKKLGIRKLTPHSTRHTYASWAVKHGVPPEILQKILGHAKYMTTAEIYVHSDTKQLVEAVEAASNNC